MYTCLRAFYCTEEKEDARYLNRIVYFESLETHEESEGGGGGFNTWWFMADVEYEPRNCEMFRNVLSTTTRSFSIIRFTFRRKVKRAILRLLLLLLLLETFIPYR